MYIISGGTGNIEGLEGIGKQQPLKDFNKFAYDSDFAYAKMQFEDTENLRIDFIRSATGEILDTSTLQKSHDERFVRQEVVSANPEI